jgi:hypothetical protein
MAIRSAGNTKRDSGELNIPGRFSGTPEAHTRGKMSIFGVPNLDLQLFLWKGDYGSLRRYLICYIVHFLQSGILYPGFRYAKLICNFKKSQEEGKLTPKG